MDISNRFSSLEIGEIGSQGCTKFEAVTPQFQSESDNGNGVATVPTPAYPNFADDSLAEVVELRNEIQVSIGPTVTQFSNTEDSQEIMDLFTVVMETWEQAGQGKSPFLVATLVSHAAFTEFENISHRLKTSWNIADPEALHHRFTQMGQILCEDNSNAAWERAIEELKKTYHQLLHLKNHSPKELAEHASFRPQTLLVLRTGPESTSKDDECITSMLQDLARHMLTHTMQTSFYRVGSPVWADVGYFLTHDKDESDGFRCTFGLQLLLKSFKSYVFASEPKIQPAVCRIRALRFAQEAIPNIGAALDDATMPCRCPNTLAFHLERLRIDLEHFLKAREFDFYFQSSWVSGSHVMEIADALFYYGLRLFSYRNLVGSLLHVYNTLRHSNSIGSIALFDSLIEVFNDILFPGGRPSRNFKLCYMRHMGGRLHFHSHKHDSGCHSMLIPVQAAKATAGFGLPRGNDDPRFDYRKTSFFLYLKEQGYLLDDGTWTQVLSILKDRNPISADHALHGQARSRQCPHHRNRPHQNPPSCTRSKLESLREALSSDFSRPFCTVKINFFKVYLACVRIVTRISDEYHGKDARPGQRCLCFAENLLLAADRCRGNEKRFRYYCCKDLVEICRTAMVEDMGNAPVEEFLWNGV